MTNMTNTTKPETLPKLLAEHDGAEIILEPYGRGAQATLDFATDLIGKIIRRLLLCLVAALSHANFGVWAADWVEVAAPGRPSDILNLGTAGHEGGITGIKELMPFDGRLYISLQAGVKEAKYAIMSYDPELADIVVEVSNAGALLGRMRVCEGRLYIPLAAPEATRSGYYVSPGKGAWEQVPVAAALALNDLALHGDRIFLAGSSNDTAVIVWRDTKSKNWNIESLNDQAARFSRRAQTLLNTPDLLLCLAVRDIKGDWPREAPERNWGAWYALRYFPQRSQRGFLFDGPARPLPALRLLAPQTSVLQDSRFLLDRDIAWQQGLLAVSRHEESFAADQHGALLLLEPNPGTPQTGGATFAGRRIADTAGVCDVTTEGDAVYILRTLDVSARRAVIAVSKDLGAWTTLFEGELPAAPLSLGVLKGKCYLGLANGSLLRLSQ